MPIKTPKGWIHIAHGVRNTAAGLRYVIYVFATDLKDPSKLIASPSGLFIAPHGSERVGDVSNVAFTNGAIVRENGDVYIYYASSDTRLHVAATTIDKLMGSEMCIRDRFFCTLKLFSSLPYPCINIALPM